MDFDSLCTNKRNRRKKVTAKLYGACEKNYKKIAVVAETTVRYQIL